MIFGGQRQRDRVVRMQGSSPWSPYGAVAASTYIRSPLAAADTKIPYTRGHRAREGQNHSSKRRIAAILWHGPPAPHPTRLIRPRGSVLSACRRPSLKPSSSPRRPGSRPESHISKGPRAVYEPKPRWRSGGYGHAQRRPVRGTNSSRPTPAGDEATSTRVRWRSSAAAGCPPARSPARDRSCRSSTGWALGRRRLRAGAGCRSGGKGLEPEHSGELGPDPFELH